MDCFMRNRRCSNLLAWELGLVELDHVFHDVDCYLDPSFWLGKGGCSLHQHLLWDYSCLIKSVYIIYFINFFTIHWSDKVVIDEKVKLTPVKYGQFSWKFLILLFKMTWKLWFKKCYKNMYLQVFTKQKMCLIPWLK